MKSNLGVGDLMIAWTMQELGKCALALGKLDQAEKWLKITEARLGADNVNVAEALVELGGCKFRRKRRS